MEGLKHEKVIGKSMKNYFFCSQLGRGVSACVYLAYNDKTDEQVAIKAIPKSYLNSDKKLMELVKTQITILKSINSQNVIRCLDVFQSPHTIFIVTEFCNDKDLQNYLNGKKFLAEDHAVMFLKQILNGFKGLHEQSVMHRDFKLANILLHDRICKIADLGFAKMMKETDLTQTVLGTGLTMAPEVLKGMPYGLKADIWSIGVVFYQLLTGKYPYSGPNYKQLLRKIQTTPIDFTIMNISPLATNFIKRCLTVNPQQRISWVQLYNHPILFKKEMQLIYGINTIHEQLKCNRDYYVRQSIQSNQMSFDSIISMSDNQMLDLLRLSYRKEMIIEEIKEINEKKTECEDMLRNSMATFESNDILLAYAKKYAIYLNAMLWPFKFLRVSLAEKIPQVPHTDALYLVFKKGLSQAKELKYIMQKRVNLFKIQNLWNAFINSKFYLTVTETVTAQFIKAFALFEEIQAQAKKSKNPVIQAQLSSKNLISKNFSQILSNEVNLYTKGIAHLLSKSKDQNLYLIQMGEGLAFYLQKEKSKLTPEHFDRFMSKPMQPYSQARQSLLKKFQQMSIQP